MGYIFQKIFQVDHTCIHSFPQLILYNILVLLLEGIIGNGAIVYHSLIISHIMIWSININPKYSDRIAHCHGKLSGDYHGYQFCSVGLFLHSILLLSVPLDFFVLRIMSNPLTDCLVLISWALYASTKLLILTGLTFGSDISGGISSTASIYISYQLGSISSSI